MNRRGFIAAVVAAVIGRLLLQPRLTDLDMDWFREQYIRPAIEAYFKAGDEWLMEQYRLEGLC